MRYRIRRVNNLPEPLAFLGLLLLERKFVHQPADQTLPSRAAVTANVGIFCPVGFWDASKATETIIKPCDVPRTGDVQASE
jgi:hypothetical protein